MRPVRIAGGDVLAPEGALVRRDLCVVDGVVAEAADAGAWRLDARGLLVLPGIVDLHGDAFERQLQPRPGIGFDATLALEDTERQLLGNGITTAYHGVTLSWEPGLRGVETWHALLAALRDGRFVCDMRVHLRWEAYNVAALETALAAIASGQVQLLGFNDHMPSILRDLGDPVKVGDYSTRAGVTPEAFRRLAAGTAARAAEVEPALERLAAAGRAAGLPMASHDDRTLAVRAAFRARGAHICEFPVSEEVASGATTAGDVVAMGSPNVVRGRSQFGWASAAAMAEAGICRVLTSDYAYPCLLEAPFALVRRGMLDLPAAWALVSANPAEAVRLADRGRLAPGRRGDVLLVAEAGGRPRLVATLVAGRIAWLSAEGAARLH